MTFRVLDLFSGIGGFSLGLERTGGFKTVAFCEIEPFCQRVLHKHWPDVPCYGDIRELTADRLRADGIAVDVLCGGFPCQDISTAGKRAGIDGERSGLWSEYARLVGELRPQFVIVENVAALLSDGIGRVLGDLAALGFNAEWHCIPASAVGAPHRRDRVWAVAYPAELLSDGCEHNTSSYSEATRTRQLGKRGCRTHVADTHEPRLERWFRRELQECASECAIRAGGAFADANGESPKWAPIARRQRGDWLTEPDVGRSPDGFPLWLERCVGRGLSYAESCRRTEVMRHLWSAHVSKTLRHAAGGLERLSQAEVLFAFVREYESGSNEARLLVAGEEASEGFLRSLRERGIARSPSYRSRQGEQRAGEHPDALQCVSRFLALNGEAAWAGNGWEDATPRVATGVPSRVDRLRGLGNAVVPQIPEIIGRAILEAEGRA